MTAALQSLTASVQQASHPVLGLQQAIDAFGTTTPFLADYLTKGAAHCKAFQSRFPETVPQPSPKIGVVQSIWCGFTGLFTDLGEAFEPKGALPLSQDELFASLFDQGKNGLLETDGNLDHLEDLLKESYPDALKQEIRGIRQNLFSLNACPPKESQGVNAAQDWAKSVEEIRSDSERLIASHHKDLKETRERAALASQSLKDMTSATLREPMSQETFASMLGNDLRKSANIPLPQLLPFASALQPLAEKSGDPRFAAAVADTIAFESFLEPFRGEMARYPLARFIKWGNEYRDVFQPGLERFQKEIGARLDELDAGKRTTVSIPLYVSETVMGSFDKLRQKMQQNPTAPPDELMDFMKDLKFSQTGYAMLQVEKGQKGNYLIRFLQSGDERIFPDVARKRLADPQFLEELLKQSSVVAEARELEPLTKLLSDGWKQYSSLSCGTQILGLAECFGKRVLGAASHVMVKRLLELGDSLKALFGRHLTNADSFERFLFKQFGGAPSAGKGVLSANPWNLWESFLSQGGKKEQALNVKLASLVHLSQAPARSDEETEILLNLNQAGLVHLEKEWDGISLPDEKILFARSIFDETKARIRERQKGYLRSLNDKTAPVSVEPLYGSFSKQIQIPDKISEASAAPISLSKCKLIDPPLALGSAPAFAKALEAEYRGGNYNGVLIAVKGFFNRFNMASLNDLFWSKLTPERAQELFLSLETISTSYFKSYFDADVPKLPDAESALLMMESMALADRLLAHLPASTHLSGRHLPLMEFAPYLFNRGVFLQFGDPRLEKRLCALRDYVEPKIDVSPLFATNLAPLKQRLFGFVSGDALATPKIMLAGFENRLVGVAEAEIDNEKSLQNYLDHFVSSYPRSSGDGKTHIYKNMLTKEEVLPKEFYAARRMTFNAEYFFRGTFAKPSAFKKTDDSYTVSFEGVDAVGELSPLVNAIYSAIGLKAFFIYPNVKGIDSSVFLENPELPDGMGRAHQFHHTTRPVVDPVVRQLEGRHLKAVPADGRGRDPFEKFVNGLMEQVFKDKFDGFSSFEPGITEAGRNLYDLNVVMVQEVEELKKYLTKQQYEELASLRTEPEVQIANSLSFFRKNPGLLHKPDLQTYFSKLLFDAPLLSRELLLKGRGPELERQLASFFQEEYALNANLQNWVAAEFALASASRLRQYALAARQENPRVYRGKPLPDFFAQLPKTLENALAMVPAGSKGLVHGLIAQKEMLQETLTSAEVEEFLRHVVLYHSDPPSGKTVDLHLAADLKRLLSRFAPPIAKAAKTDPALLVRIAKEAYPSLPDDAQCASAPENALLYICKEAGVTLDLREGVLLAPGITGATLPADGLSSPAYTALYGTREFQCRPISQNTFEFTDNRSLLNRLVRQPSGEYVLQRKFPRGWHQYIPQGVLLGELKKESEIEQQLRALLRFDQPTKILPALPLIEGHTHWYNSDTPGDLLIVDERGRTRYRVEIGSSEILHLADAHKILKKIHRLAPDGKDQFELVDTSQERHPFSWTRQFEDPKQTLIWKDPATQEAARIEFPRFNKEGLTFVRDGQLFKSEQFPGFYLKKRQINPLGVHCPNFLILENKKGDEKLLLAAQPIIPASKGSLSTRLRFDRRADLLKTHQTYFAYDKPKGESSFASDGTAANFYLALIHGAKKRYKEAVLLLRQFGRGSARFTQEERETLQAITNLNVLMNHEGPHLLSLRALAAAALTQNDPDSAKQMKSVAEAYFGALPQLGLLRLQGEEEFSLLETILGPDAVELAEVRKLMKQNPEKARDAIGALGRGGNLDPSTVEAWLQNAARKGARAAAPDSAAAPDLWSLSPILENPSQFVSKAGVVDREGAKSDLETLLKDHGVSPIEKKAFAFYLKDSLFYLKNRDQNEYRLHDLAALSQKREELEETYQYMQEALAASELSILRLASKLPKDPVEAAKAESRREEGSPVELSDLIALYRANDLASLMKMNPELKKADIAALDRLIDLYLDLSIQNHQRKIVVARIADIEQLGACPKGDPQLQLALESFMREALVGRQFTPTEKNRFLKVFEYYNGFYYRKEQVDALPEIGVSVDAKSDALLFEYIIRELMVGRGKTTYLLPTKAFWSADGERLSMALLPEALIGNMKPRIERILGKSFSQRIIPFEFNIQTDLGSENLNKILRTLNDAIEKKQFLVATDRSMKALRNQFIRILREYLNKPGDKALVERAELVRQILKVFREKGDVLADEADLILHPRFELNFPAGEPEPISETFISLSLKVYELLIRPEIQKIASFEFSPSAAPACTPLRYESEVKPALAKLLLSSLETDGEFTALQKHYRKCTLKQKQWLENYLKGSDPGHVGEQWVASLPSDLKDSLGLLRGQLNILLPLTLRKNFEEGYGFHTEDSVTAGPFSGCNSPNLGSQFSDPFEWIDYTIQSYLKEKGIRRPILEKLIQDLQQRALKEMKENLEEVKKNPNYKTQAHLEFERYFGARNDLQLFHSDIVERLSLALHNEPKTKFSLLAKYILPQVKVFPENLKATSQSFGSLFSRVKGFSGTVWNYGTYHDRFEPRFDDGARGQVVALAFAQAKGKVNTIQVQDPAKLDLDLLLENPKYSHISALIDAGGALKEFDPKKTAKAWLEKLSLRNDPAEGVVFFDASDREWICEKGEAEPIPLEKSACPPSKRKTLYDQRHTTGTDVKQAIDAIALVTVSKGMILRDFIQAVGRMRQIASGQKIEIAILESDALAIRELLGLKKDAKLEIEEVIRFLILNEARRQGEDNEVATNHKLIATLQEWVLEKALGLTHIKELGRSLKHPEFVEKLFFNSHSVSPFQNYGQGTDLIDSETAFQERIEGVLAAVGAEASFQGDPFLDPNKTNLNLLRSQMTQSVGKIIQKAELPSEVRKAPPTLGMEQQVEIMQEQQQQEQQEQQQQQEEMREKRTQEKPWSHLPWPDLTPYSVEKSTLYDSSLFRQANAEARLGIHPIRETVFDNRFLVSQNFRAGAGTPQYKRFGIYQKPLQNILIVQNQKTKAFKVIALEPFDAAAFKRALQVKQGETPLKKDPDIKTASPWLIINTRCFLSGALLDTYSRDFFSMKNDWPNLFPEGSPYLASMGMGRGDPVSLWLGDLNLNSLYESDTPIPKRDLESDDLRSVLAQAKYFDGHVHYKESERDLLKTWLSGLAGKRNRLNNIQLLENEFKKTILAFKEQSKRDYPQSSLAQIFKELREES